MLPIQKLSFPSFNLKLSNPLSGGFDAFYGCDFLETVIISVLTSVAIPLVFYLFEKARKQEEKCLSDSKNFKVQITKSVRIFFLCFWLVILAIMLLILATDIHITELLIIEGLIGAFSLLPAFGYLNARFNYFIVSEENIVHVRMFGKNKIIKYSDIFYIQYYCKGDSLAVYSKYGIPLITIDRIFVGIEKLTDLLEEKCIRTESTQILTEEMKNSEEYKQYEQKSKITVAVICLILVIVLALSICIGVMLSN